MVSIRQILLVVLGGLCFFSLSGCAMIRSYHETKNECVSSNVLYANLVTPVKHRVFHLKDGRDCTSFYKKENS